MFRVSALAILLGTSLLVLGIPAWADPVTLRCTWTPNMSSLAGQQVTMDFDLERGVVQPSVSAVHRIDQVSDRYIYYGAGEIPQNTGSSWRLDRRTGVIEAQNIESHSFVPIMNCQRVQGKVM
ncbi:MAG TPA: hypothetical protein VN668_05925 [Stellaceae bacterium]|nr:hypothetical protein [Stellaceae bacterium]